MWRRLLSESFTRVPKSRRSWPASANTLAERKNASTTNYSDLSEFCHPNSFAFTNHIDMEKAGAQGGEVKVVFLMPH